MRQQHALSMGPCPTRIRGMELATSLVTLDRLAVIPPCPRITAMPRSAADWEAKPKFPSSHYVDTRIYTDETLFREEQEKIFNKCWIIACHESELPGALG